MFISLSSPSLSARLSLSRSRFLDSRTGRAVGCPGSRSARLAIEAQLAAAGAALAVAAAPLVSTSRRGPIQLPVALASAPMMQRQRTNCKSASQSATAKWIATHRATGSSVLSQDAIPANPVLQGQPRATGLGSTEAG